MDDYNLSPVKINERSLLQFTRMYESI